MLKEVQIFGLYKNLVTTFTSSKWSSLGIFPSSLIDYENQRATVQRPHWIIQSVVATGGVYKGQGRNQHGLNEPCLLGIPRSWEIFASPNPEREWVWYDFPLLSEQKHTTPSIVARVQPRTSKGITDLLLLFLRRLDVAYLSKKIMRQSTRHIGYNDNANHNPRHSRRNSTRYETKHRASATTESSFTKP